MNQSTNQNIICRFQRPSRSHSRFQRILRRPRRSRPQNTMNSSILNIGRRIRSRPQNNINPSTNDSVAIQRYTVFVEGFNPFIELQVAEIPLQNTQFQTALLL
ncbi:23159_t:CDS:1, partial [Racocetra persica]